MAGRVAWQEQRPISALGLRRLPCAKFAGDGLGAEVQAGAAVFARHRAVHHRFRPDRLIAAATSPLGLYTVQAMVME